MRKFRVIVEMVLTDSGFAEYGDPSGWDWNMFLGPSEEEEGTLSVEVIESTEVKA